MSLQYLIARFDYAYLLFYFIYIFICVSIVWQIYIPFFLVMLVASTWNRTLKPCRLFPNQQNQTCKHYLYSHFTFVCVASQKQNDHFSWCWQADRRKNNNKDHSVCIIHLKKKENWKVSGWDQATQAYRGEHTYTHTQICVCMSVHVCACAYGKVFIPFVSKSIYITL